MRAVGYTQAGPIDAPDALIEFEAEDPTPGPHDLLVEVRGISVNPVDTKVRAGRAPDPAPGILGYDAAGIVRAVGSEVRRFKVGDAVFHAGDIMRPGTNAESHVVDERIVGRKPESLDFAEAAGLPLTSITAWEMLFDCFGLAEGDGAGESLLVVGAAGGVGSILVQLAKQLTQLEVTATAFASRDGGMGAAHGGGSCHQSPRFAGRAGRGARSCAGLHRCPHRHGRTSARPGRVGSPARAYRGD